MSIWTTDATHWADRNVRGVESVFFHHPNASLTIYSNKLPASAVGAIASLGFDVRVLPYNLTQLLHGTPAAPWLGKLSRWEQGPYFYTHVTDVIRLALLFRDGGVYVDTDVVLVRPFRIAAAAVVAAAELEERQERQKRRGARDGAQPVRAWRDARAAADVADERNASAGAAREPLPLAPHSLGAEAHTVSDTPIVNGAIMVFARGSPFLWGAMREFAGTYRDFEWGWNGPELLTRVRRRCPHNVSVLGEERFYPFHWEEVALYSTAGHEAANEAMWRVIEQRSYAAHLWNKKSAELPLHADSVYARLMRAFRVLPDGVAAGKAGGTHAAAEARAHQLVADGIAAGAVL